MVSLQDFRSIPYAGNVSVCEKNGRLCTLPVTEVGVSRFGGADNLLSSYPEISINREILHHIPTTSSSQSNEDYRKILLTPTDEILPKRLIRIFLEDGLLETLNEAEKSYNQHPVIGSLAHYLKRFLHVTSQLNQKLWPYAADKGVNTISKYIQTRDWLHSPIRCIKWHPNYFRLAIASSDDSIRIYTKTINSGIGIIGINDEQLPYVPVLKSGLQKSVSSLAWRPYTAGELAVGCQNGIMLWTIDPGAHIRRSLSQMTQLKSSGHAPVTSVEWNSNGTLLASASIKDTDILIWDVDHNKNVALRRIGFPCVFLKWSPNNRYLCSTTIGNVFRVWETDKWTPERWTVSNESVQSVAWSPCSSFLLFVTTGEPILYSLEFAEKHLYASKSIPKQALPIADLTQITVEQTVIGGQPQIICWDPSGKYVAISFKNSSSIAIFATTIAQNNLNISPSFFINGLRTDEYPSFICFKEIYDNDREVILTIGWSTGRIQYFPFLS